MKKIHILCYLFFILTIACKSNSNTKEEIQDINNNELENKFSVEFKEEPNIIDEAQKRIAQTLKNEGFDSIIINPNDVYKTSIIDSIIETIGDNKTSIIETIGDTTYIYKNDIEEVKQLGEECNLNSDCINNYCQKHFKGKYCSLKKGDKFPEFKLYNQFGEHVSLYEFINKDKYILLEMGTVWCSPCNDLAGWLAFGEDNIKSKSFWKTKYDRIYDLVKNDQIYFITVLYEDEFRNNATLETVEEWYRTFPDENVTVLADENKLLHTLIKPTGIPAVTLLNSNMEVVSLSTRGFNEAFDKILKIFE